VAAWRSLLLAALLVAGCSDDGPREDATVTTPSTSSTAAPEPPVTATTEPSATTEPTGTTDTTDTVEPPDTTEPAPGAPDGPPCDDPGEPAEGDAIGWADADGDGRAELWVRTGSGASTLLLGVYTYDSDCEPVRVTLAGQPAELSAGGSVTNLSGLSCDPDDADADLVAYSAQSSDGVEYTITAQSFALEGSELVELAVESFTADGSAPGFGRYTTFVCGGLVL
jgi:hypothetical protein